MGQNKSSLLCEFNKLYLIIETKITVTLDGQDNGF